jgi:hypothetical protein
MAFSPEQKKRIKARAEELVATGIGTGEAAQQAVAELFSPEEIEAAFAPIPAPEPVEPIVETRSPDIQELDVKLEDQETKFLRERKRQLESTGLSPEDAESQAREELEFYREPAPLGFGSPAERREEAEGLFRLVPSEETAGAFGLQEKPIGKQQGPSGIDYKAVGEIFSKAYGESEEEGLADAEAFRQFIVEPRLAKLKEEGVIGREASKQALEEGFAVLQNIQERIENKETYLQPETLGSGDPLIRAFSRQVTLGEGVPDLTPEQVRFINARENRRVARAIESKKGEKTTVVVLADGTELPKSVYEEQVKMSPELGEPVSEKQVDKTEAQIRLELGEEAKIPWYLDPKKKVEVIADPEKFEKQGIIVSESPYGTQTETGANWLLRSALAIPNTLAGAVMKAGYDLGPLEEAREEARKAKGYESAILLNIAENRGFMGEAAEAAKLSGIEEGSPLYYTTLAGGFAGDILDPSIDLLKAGVVGRRSYKSAMNKLDSLYQGLSKTEKRAEAAKIGVAIGYRDFLDSHIIGSLIGKQFDAGDVRSILARNLTDDYAATIEASRLIENATEDLTPQQVIDYLNQQGYGNTKFAKRFASGSAGKELAVDVLEEMKQLFKDDIILNLEQIGRGLDGATGAIRQKDLARAVGSLAKEDETIEAVLRALPTDKTKPKFVQYAEKLMSEPRTARLLTKAVAFNKAATDVVKATKDIDAFDNLVFITQNTLAGKGAARQILQKVKESEIGKIANDLAGTEPTLVATADQAVRTPGQQVPTEIIAQQTTSPVVQPAYKVTDEQAKTLNQITTELRTYGKVSQETQTVIRTRLARGIITNKDLRILLDANIDLVAEGMAATKGLAGVTRARDLARLPVGENIDLLKPLESRTFAAPVLRRIREKLQGSKAIQSNLSVGQKQLLQRAQAEAASLDQRLVRDLKRALSDEEFRKLYGIEEGATRSEILGHLIIGPKESVAPLGFGRLPTETQKVLDAGAEGISTDFSIYRAKTTKQDISNLLFDTINDLFYSKETKENIFDVLTGTNVERNTGVLTDEGRGKIQELVEQAAIRIEEKPGTYFDEVLELAKKVDEIIATGDKRLIAYEPEDIIRAIDKDGGLSAETQIASYYRAEANRIVENLIGDLVNKEIGKGGLNVDAYFDKDYLGQFRTTLSNFISETGGRIGGGKTASDSLKEVFGTKTMSRMVQDRIEAILAGDDLTFTANDLVRILNKDGRRIVTAVPGLIEKVAKETNLDDIIQPVVDAAEDIARGIIRRNGLKNNDIDIMKMDKLFDEVRDSESLTAQLELLFGRDVAKQLEDEFLGGYEKLREELVKLASKRYEAPTGVSDKAARALDEAYKAYVNATYTILLNLRPRFHGANLLTGMDIAYATTGRVTNPLDILEGARILSGKKPNRIVFTDPAGRSYTEGELLSILQDVTGRSVFRPDLPSASSERLINLLEDPTNRTKLQEGWNQFKELPQTEDLTFRYAILKQALMEGRSLDEAIALARTSMFDSSQITGAESTIRNLALFYGFARNNLANTLKNVTSAKGIKRLGRAKRIRDNLSRFFVDEETQEYAPSYTQNRVLLGKIGFDPEKGKDQVIAGPPLASLDGLYTLAEFIKLEPTGVLGGAIRPEYKALFGVEDRFDREFKKVPPEHIAILRMIPGLAPDDVVNYLMAGMGAEPVIGVPGTPEEGAVDGIIYPLNTPQQRKAYKKFFDIFALTGLTTFGSDIARTAGVGSTQKLGLPGQLFAFGTAAGTPMTMMSPERQAYYDRLSRLRDLQAVVRATVSDESKRLEAEVPQEEKAKAKEIKEIKEEARQIKKIKPTTKEQRMLELKREKDRIISATRTGKMTTPEAYRRLQEIQKEAEALK